MVKLVVGLIYKTSLVSLSFYACSNYIYMLGMIDWPPIIIGRYSAIGALQVVSKKAGQKVWSEATKLDSLIYYLAFSLSLPIFIKSYVFLHC